MGRESTLKFKGDKEELRHIIDKYIYSEDSKYDEITLNYLGKWIWMYIDYNENKEILLDVNFSKEFLDDEIESFIKEMNSIGFLID